MSQKNMRFIGVSTASSSIMKIFPSWSKTLNLNAGNAVVITSSSLRLTQFTNAQTSSLTATNGDLIYNTTSNKFWGYAGGAWVALH